MRRNGGQIWINFNRPRAASNRNWKHRGRDTMQRGTVVPKAPLVSAGAERLAEQLAPPSLARRSLLADEPRSPAHQ